MAEQGRVPAPELNLRPQLNPAPVVNVVGVAPVNRQGAGSNLISIAESLSGLSSAFKQFSNNTMTPMQDKADTYGAGELAGKSYEELHTYFKQNPDLLKREKYAMMYAGKYANTFGTQLQSGELTADWDGKEPIDQFIARKQQSFVDQLPNDPMIRAYFNQSANPYTEAYIQGHTKVVADNKVASDLDALTANADNAVAQSKVATGATRSAAGTATRLPIVAGYQAGRQPLQMKGVNGVLLDRFEQVQGVFGKQVPVVSGFRDPITNKKAGGAEHSQHLHGNALDLDITGMSPDDKRRLAQIASAMGFNGIGFGENSLHIDMRQGKHIWGYGPGGSIPTWAQSVALKHKAGAIKGIPHSVAASSVAVDNIFSTVTDSPAYKQLQPSQQNAFWFDYASKFEVKNEDDLKIVEGILNHKQANGVPSISETSDYSEKSRILLELKREEFRKTNTEAQTPILLKVNEAIDNGMGITEIKKIREATGENYFSPSFWQDAEVKAAAKEKEVQQKQSALHAYNAAVDKVRFENVKAYMTGNASSEFNDVSVPDPNNPGKMTNYSGADQKTDARNIVLQQIDKMVEENNLPEEARWGLVASYLGKSNDTVPAWQANLEAVPKSYNPADAANGGINDQTLKTAKMYDYLKNSGNYLFLDANMKGDGTKTFWSMYDSFRGQGQNEREALFSTYKVMNDKGAMAQAHEEVNFAKGAYYKSGISFADSELNGNSIAAARVTDMAEALAATNHSGSDALEMALKLYKDTHVYAKGAWVSKSLKGLPDNFVDNVTEYVDHYISQYGAKANPPITDPEDVIIAPDASGNRFYLFQKSTGLPIMGKDVKGGVSKKGVLAVTMGTLRGYDKLKNDKAQIAAEQDQAAMVDAIAQADGTSNAPMKTITPGLRAQALGVTEKKVPMTPQEIVDQGKKAKADAVAKDIKTSERLNPNNLKIKPENIKELTDDEFRGYVDRAASDPNKYPPAEWDRIKSEAKRRGWNIE